MKSLLSIAIVAVVLPTFLSVQAKEKITPGATGAEKEVKKVISEVSEAQLKGDSATLEWCLANDYTFTNPMGEVMTKEQAVSAIKSGDVRFQSFKTDDLRLRLYGDTAIATGHVTVKGQRNGQDISGQYRATWVLVKEQGRWQPVAAQATRIAESVLAGSHQPQAKKTTAE